MRRGRRRGKEKGKKGRKGRCDEAGVVELGLCGEVEAGGRGCRNGRAGC